MRFQTCIIATLLALAMAVNIPNIGLAQDNQPAPPQNQTGAQAPQPVGDVATVIGVDQPDNCLRIRSGPGNDYDVIGCANMGDQLKITGVWTSNDWAQLADNGWVYGPQISTDLRPPRTAYSSAPTYVVSQVVPDYDDWSYLPDYGYDTYWYGAVPIFFYNAAIWRWCHPWWWWHGCQAWWWRDGFHGRRPWNANSFRNFANTRGVNFAATQRANVSALNRMGRTTRSASIASSNVNQFNVNRSNITSPNINRFNTNTFRSGSTNAFRSGTFSTPNRTFSTPYRSFSTPYRSFSTPQTFRSFSSPRSFSMGSSGVRSFGGFAGRSSMGVGRHR